MDTSSGASMSVREMLRQLVAQGYEVMILGSTIFDNPKGATRLQHQWPDIAAKHHQMAEVEDGELTHHLLVTQNTNRNALTTHESDLWYGQYIYLLDSFKPDVVWFYGGQTLELLIPGEARARGIPSAFYLANGNYRSHFWNRDIDLILTDSQATADMYREKVGFTPIPVGKFIDSERFIAESHERKHLLFVNPNWEKGASIVIQLALLLENNRPDITLEVIEARGDWGALVRETTQRLGSPRESLPNVVVTSNTDDMRPVYERARVLLAPSLWWESGARVLAEAMLNGIPAIVSNHGGSPGLIENGGVVLDFPVACHEKPYKHLLTQEELQPLLDTVVGFYDDQSLYDEYVERAYCVGKEKHHISISTRRLTQALDPLVAQKAGNKDFLHPQRKLHKHNLAGIAGKPNFSQHEPAPSAPTSSRQVTVSPAKASQQPSQQTSQIAEAQHADFDWQLSGKIIALDNRAKLIHSGALNTLLATKAFSIIAFDPASEVKVPEQYEGKDDIQLFPHALLGDGNPATLYACLDSTLTSTLAPLPSEQLSQHNRQGAQVIAKLPINTIALDSIEGLASLDWLILDDLSDASNILEHGGKALKNTLLIQARVAFQPTHERQPDIAQLSHWASRNGFRFYRLNDTSHQSLFPEDTNASKRFASELTSADVLFLPSEERLEAMPDNDKQKLVFLLHTVFKASDMAYRIMRSVSAALAQDYLDFIEEKAKSKLYKIKCIDAAQEKRTPVKNKKNKILFSEADFILQESRALFEKGNTNAALNVIRKPFSLIKNKSNYPHEKIIRPEVDRKNVKKVLILGSKPSAKIPSGCDVVVLPNSSIFYYAEEIASIEYKVCCLSPFLLDYEKDSRGLEKYTANEIWLLGGTSHVNKIYSNKTKYGSWVNGINFDERRELVENATDLCGPLISKEFFLLNPESQLEIFYSELEFRDFVISENKSECHSKFDWHEAFRPSTGILSLIMAVASFGDSVDYYLSGVGVSKRYEYQDSQNVVSKRLTDKKDGMKLHVNADIEVVKKLRKRYKITVCDKIMEKKTR